MRGELGRLLLVTDAGAAEARGTTVAAALEAALAKLPPGAAVIELRDKGASASDLFAQTRRLLRVTRPRRCPLLVNDRVDVAIAAGADGVHLPERGLSISAARRMAPSARFLVGVSTHSADRAGAAANDGADVIVCGPVFATPSKAGLGEPLGLAELGRAARAVTGGRGRGVLYAIGGVDAACAGACRDAGAHGVAAVRAWLDDAEGLLASVS